MFIQDSYYYQAFAYVLKIDEQLQSYASVVRSMLHPSGMAMFGEYSINNKVALSVGLSALVKSLGVTLYDSVSFEELVTWYLTKDLSDTQPTFDVLQRIAFSKYLEDSFTVSHGETNFSKVFGKQFGLTTDVVNQQVLVTEYLVQTFTKRTTDDTVDTVQNEVINRFFTKDRTDNISMGEERTLVASLNMDIDTLTTANFGNSGYIIVDPYDQGGYFEEHYANSRPSEWTV
jgi:hypothetical protein